MLLARRMHNSNFAHPERLHGLHAAPRAYPPNLANLHEYAPTGLADELHVLEHGAVAAVLEVRPDALLRVADLVEVVGRGRLDGAARDARDEARTEEDVQDAQVLRRVRDGDILVARAEGILDAGAEVVGARHRSESEELWV
ncbi:hypothetical protein EVG20_g5841 [Dentipellis fragilis]|uniref:Uncharacterized protein n=1 Tax=Dentipellis fragilis TaxID=205917 RepID=A0A4Y9YSS0_9AGAM|nr:hypothetical protein EVG20_g5841 [Dentipellis fragilis]